MSRVWKADQLNLTVPWQPTLVRRGDAEPQPLPADPSPQPSAAEQAAQLLAEAQQQAAAIIAEARATAASIQAEAEQAATARQEAGYAAGLAAGRAAGETAGRNSFRQAEQALQSARQRLVEKDRALLQESAAEVTQLALAVALRVIGQQLTGDEQSVQASLRQVMAAAMGAREVLLQVSADDFEHLWAKRQEWQQNLPGVRQFELQVDASLSRGDLVLVSNQGTVDARVDTILQQVADQLGAGVV